MEYISEYLSKIENRHLEITKYEISDPNFQNLIFGNKTFEKIHVVYETKDGVKEVDFIKKIYHGTDVSMILSDDNHYREIEFYKSILFKEFEKFFVIPIIAVDNERKIIYLKESSKELSRFGPPEMPTEEQLYLLIKKVAEKDAVLNQSVEFPARQYIETLRIMKEILMESCAGIQKVKSNWPWLFNGTDVFKNEYAEEWDNLINLYDEKHLKEEIISIPQAYQHGDFFFSNIGFKNGETPLVIDWEWITYGPVGLDFISLTDGMPPLPFVKHFTDWYITSYNEKADTSITKSEVEHWFSVIRKGNFLINSTIDVLRFGFNEQSHLPKDVRNKLKNNYLSELKEK